MTTSPDRAGLHGVAVVDRYGPECICGRDFPYKSGGWLAFNEHIAALLLAAPGDSEGPWLDGLATALREEEAVRGVSRRYGTFNDAYYDEFAKAIAARLRDDRAGT